MAGFKERVAELVEAGDREAGHRLSGGVAPLIWPATRACPGGCTGAALLSPFDNLIWRRERTERLFGLRYRIEIYTPAHKREHGYYVLPFLLGEALVARVDLKADRQERRPARTSRALRSLVRHRMRQSRSSAALRRMAVWLGLADVTIVGSRPLEDILRACSGG